MSIRAEAEDDIKAAKQVRPPRWALVLIGFACLPVFWLFDHFGSLNIALPVLNGLIVLAFVLYVKRRLFRKWWFWLTIALIELVHALVIWSIPWTDDWHPALVGGVIASLDVCLILWILATVDTLVGATGNKSQR
jgi:hypothetical protein